MSLGYAEKLSFREDLGGQLGAPELFDTADEVEAKVERLAQLVRSMGGLVGLGAENEHGMCYRTCPCTGHDAAVLPHYTVLNQRACQTCAGSSTACLCSCVPSHAQVRQARRIIAFTGAGISTACGIPDFRGPSGIWTLQRAGQPLPRPKVSFTHAKPSLTHQVRPGVLGVRCTAQLCNTHVSVPCSCC